AVRARDVERHTASALRFERPIDREARQSRGLGFFGQRRRRKEPAADRDATGPRALPHERGQAWAHGRSDRVVGVEPSADRHRQPALYVDVVLYEHAGNVVLITEARVIARIERRALERCTAHPRLTWRRATHRELGEDRVL